MVAETEVEEILENFVSLKRPSTSESATNLAYLVSQ